MTPEDTPLLRLTPGAALRLAVTEESPLQLPGAINANHALLAKQAGFRAIYLSGGGVLSEAGSTRSVVEEK